MVVTVYQDSNHSVEQLPTGVPARAAAAAATTATAAKTAFGLGTGFVHVQRTAIQFPAIQLGDRTIRFRVSAHLNESKTTCLTSVTICHEADAIHSAISLKQSAHLIFRGTVTQISYENILHFFLSGLGFPKTRQDRTRAGGPDQCEDAKELTLPDYNMKMLYATLDIHPLP